MASELEDILEEVGIQEKQQPTQKTIAEPCEDKRERLRILAAGGSSLEYLGKQLSLGDVERLSPKDVEKYHARYEAVFARRVQQNAIRGVLKAVVKSIAFILPYANLRLKDEDKLLTTLQDDKLVTTELANRSCDWLVNNRLSPYLALASAACTTSSHVERMPTPIKDMSTDLIVKQDE